jgi:SAM-dependent methyltransferase
MPQLTSVRRYRTQEVAGSSPASPRGDGDAVARQFEVLLLDRQTARRVVLGLEKPVRLVQSKCARLRVRCAVCPATSPVSQSPEPGWVYSRLVMDVDVAAERADRPFAGDPARFYARYRREYPPELISRLREFSRGGRGHLLDLGCGTGQLLLQLAGFFDHAVGLDPEPDMLREARRLAHERNIDNAEWRAGSSRELPELESTLGRFDLVTVGTAFHFMEPRATLSQLRQIAPRGAVAVIYNGSPMWLHPDPWAQALRAALEARLGPLESADFTATALHACEAAMRELAYGRIEYWEHTHDETIDVEFVVGHILSATSETQIPATEREHFANEVRSAITAIAPSGRVTERVPVRAVIGRTS